MDWSFTHVFFKWLELEVNIHTVVKEVARQGLIIQLNCFNKSILIAELV